MILEVEAVEVQGGGGGVLPRAIFSALLDVDPRRCFSGSCLGLFYGLSGKGVSSNAFSKNWLHTC